MGVWVEWGEEGGYTIYIRYYFARYLSFFFIYRYCVKLLGGLSRDVDGRVEVSGAPAMAKGLICGLCAY